MTVFLAPINAGLGDLIVSLPPLQYLIDTEQNPHLVLRSFRHGGIAERIEGLAGTIKESDLLVPASRLDADRLINLRDHWLQTDHIWGSRDFEQTFGDFNIEDIISKISGDFGLLPNYKNLVPLRFNRRLGLERAVALIPGADDPYKFWSMNNWIVVSDFLRKNGLQPILLGRPDEAAPVKELAKQGIALEATPTIGDAIDVLSGCHAVVAVDTGLMHVAVQQGTPTIGLFSARNKAYVRRQPHFTGLFSRPCAQECHSQVSFSGSLRSLTYNEDWQPEQKRCFLADEQSCMSTIEPETVTQALERLLISISGRRGCGL